VQKQQRFASAALFEVKLETVDVESHGVRLPPWPA
jgi:hypothetical protein